MGGRGQKQAVSNRRCLLHWWQTPRYLPLVRHLPWASASRLLTLPQMHPNSPPSDDTNPRPPPCPACHPPSARLIWSWREPSDARITSLLRASATLILDWRWPSDSRIWWKEQGRLQQGVTKRDVGCSCGTKQTLCPACCTRYPSKGPPNACLPVRACDAPPPPAAPWRCAPLPAA